jgi:FlaA1/EpsC-like NDP-sugar epimerase
MKSPPSSAAQCTTFLDVNSAGMMVTRLIYESSSSCAVKIVSAFLQSVKMNSLFSKPSWSAGNIPDLARKIFVVTGGSAGIGFGITANLLSHNPGRIYMLSEKSTHADLALQELQKYGDPSRVKWVKCNLQDLNEVNKVGQDLRERLEEDGRLDALICNAGIGVGVYNLSCDGIGELALRPVGGSGC